MNDVDAVALIRDALWITVKISSPILITAMVVGLIIGILQTTTSIQEPTIAFVPKLLAIFFVIVFFASWMLKNLMDYTKNLFYLIEKL